MKTTLCFMIMGVIAGLPGALADVTKSVSNEVEFPGTGKFIVERVQKITPEKRLEIKRQQFEGQGLLGMAAKLFLKSGHFSEIIDLDEMTITEINHTDKTYRIRPIQPLTTDTRVSAEESGAAPTGDDEWSSEPSSQSSDVQIIRNDFWIEHTNQRESIRGYPCEKYLAFWVLEWKNTRTEETGKDSLRTEIWATENRSDFEQADQMEQEFQAAYLKALGIEMSRFQEEVLGLNWLRIFQQLKSQEREIHTPENGMFQEFKKIKGYPVRIQGAFYVTTTKEKQSGSASEEPSEAIDLSQPKSLFGGLTKKALKGRWMKKKASSERSSGPRPAFRYRTEIQQVTIQPLAPETFTVPAGYRSVE